MHNRLSSFQRSRKNLNLGTARGQQVLRKSIEQCGWMDAMTVGADGQVITGHHRLAIARETGAEPIVVRSDGTRPIIHIRTDLRNGDPRNRKGPILANRAEQLNVRFDQGRLRRALRAVGVSAGEMGFQSGEIKMVAPPLCKGMLSRPSSQGPAVASIGNSCRVVVECVDEADLAAICAKLAVTRNCRMIIR